MNQCLDLLIVLKDVSMQKKPKAFSWLGVGSPSFMDSAWLVWECGSTWCLKTSEPQDVVNAAAVKKDQFHRQRIERLQWWAQSFMELWVQVTSLSIWLGTPLLSKAQSPMARKSSNGCVAWLWLDGTSWTSRNTTNMLLIKTCLEVK